ncbi:MAG: hypothetical protein LBR79_03670 [Oscillospiraceae bacterium]|nr:hypothetical protein [Oscillospiraceae bacterium]
MKSLLFLSPQGGEKNKNIAVLKSFLLYCLRFPPPSAGGKQKCYCFKKFLLYY